MKMKFNVAVRSDLGLVRKNNEDNFYVPLIGIKPMREDVYEENVEFVADKAYICVCDGMGGHSSGEVASYMASKITEKKYQTITDGSIKNKKTLEKVLQNFISDTNDEIYNRTVAEPDLKTMGTTMTGLYFMDNKAYFVNVGDSRSYFLKGTKFKQLSIDHADASSKNAITRFLGMSTEYGRMEADVAYVPSKIGTHCRYILCSDGLTDMVDDKSIAGALIKFKDPGRAADELIELAKRNGGKDNITVAVIDVCPNGIAAKAIHNKVLTGCAAAALVLGTAGLAGYILRPEPEAGMELNMLAAEIETSNYMEAKEKAEDFLDKVRNYIKELSDSAASVDESDDSVRAANAELRAEIEKLTGSCDRLDENISEADGSNKSDSEKHKLLNSIVDEVTKQEKVCRDKEKIVEETAAAVVQRQKKDKINVKKEKKESERNKAIEKTAPPPVTKSESTRTTPSPYVSGDKGGLPDEPQRKSPSPATSNPPQSNNGGKPNAGNNLDK